MSRQGLLIADEDLVSRKQLTELFSGAGYEVTAPVSVAGALHGILKKAAKVVLLSTRFDELLASEVIPLLKRCNRDLTIILVASEIPLALLRKLRHEGIFYHALKPVQPGDEDELCQAVKCAFDKTGRRQRNDEPPAG